MIYVSAIQTVQGNFSLRAISRLCQSCCLYGISSMFQLYMWARRYSPSSDNPGARLQKNNPVLSELQKGIIMRLIEAIITLIMIFLPVVSYAASATLYETAYLEYPQSIYIVGIAEVPKTDNPYNDKRVAEVMARLDIAKQIKVRIKSESIDRQCEGTSYKIFGDQGECRSEFSAIVEETVDEFLAGSRIVKHGEREDLVYAIAVLKRKGTAENLNEKAGYAVDKAKEELKKAEKGDKDSLKKAEEAYKKAVVLDNEKEIIEGVKSNAAKAFDNLGKEIVHLKEKAAKVEEK